MATHGKGFPAAALLSAALLASAALAQAAAPSRDDALSPYYASTLVCHSATQQCHIWLQRDGTFREYVLAQGADGKFSLTGLEGIYKVSERNGVSETCLMPLGNGGPMGMRPPECYALAGHKVGEEWSVESGTAGRVTLALRAGRQINALVGFLN